MVFRISSDRRAVITSHALYNLTPKEVMYADKNELEFLRNQSYHIVEDNLGKPGTLLIDEQKREFHISTGKRGRMHNAIVKAAKHIFSQAVQLNVFITINNDLYSEIGDVLNANILDRGVKIVVIK